MRWWYQIQFAYFWKMSMGINCVFVLLYAFIQQLCGICNLCPYFSEMLHLIAGNCQMRKEMEVWLYMRCILIFSQNVFLQSWDMIRNWESHESVEIMNQGAKQRILPLTVTWKDSYPLMNHESMFQWKRIVVEQAIVLTHIFRHMTSLGHNELMNWPTPLFFCRCAVFGQLWHHWWRHPGPDCGPRWRACGDIWLRWDGWTHIEAQSCEWGPQGGGMVQSLKGLRGEKWIGDGWTRSEAQLCEWGSGWGEWMGDGWTQTEAQLCEWGSGWGEWMGDGWTQTEAQLCEWGSGWGEWMGDGWTQTEAQLCEWGSGSGKWTGDFFFVKSAVWSSKYSSITYCVCCAGLQWECDFCPRWSCLCGWLWWSRLFNIRWWVREPWSLQLWSGGVFQKCVCPLKSESS